MRFWNAVLVLSSAANVLFVWFAAGDPPWHATTHAVLAVVLGLWAQRRMGFEDRRLPAGERDERSEDDIAALRDEAGEVRRELGEVQERLDFTERLLTQAREGERLRDRREP